MPLFDLPSAITSKPRVINVNDCDIDDMCNNLLTLYLKCYLLAVLCNIGTPTCMILLTYERSLSHMRVRAVANAKFAPTSKVTHQRLLC